MSRINVLIADKFAPSGVDELVAAGCDVTCDPGLSGDALREKIAATGCRVLVVRGTKVTADMLEASSELAVVVRAGAGYNTIDVAAASMRSVLVANCPGKNAVAVAELTLGLILALDRRLADNVSDLRNGVWNKGDYAKARGLKRRTLGIVGLGEIGKAVASRALAFEMNVLGWSRSLTNKAATRLGIERCDTIGELASRSDVLTVHLAANDDTRGIISAAVIEKLKAGSYLINTSRAGVLDYEALALAIRDRGIRAGLDVFPSEPGGGASAFSDPIVNVEGVVYGTHHIGASTEQAQEAIARETIRIIKEYKTTGHVPHCVNVQGESPARYVLVVRHRNRPGVLAHTLDAISHGGINVQEMENIICAGAQAACARILLDGPLPEEVLTKIRMGNEHVFAVTISPLKD